MKTGEKRSTSSEVLNLCGTSFCYHKFSSNFLAMLIIDRQVFCQTRVRAEVSKKVSSRFPSNMRVTQRPSNKKSWCMP